MDRINIGIVGTGWCGGIRAVTCAANPLVNDLHIAETNPERLAEVRAQVGAATATADYRELLARDDIDAIIVSTTPETTHYPLTKESLVDVYYMFAAGLVGYVLYRFGFPLAPMVLAVILGPLADENLRRALLVIEDEPYWTLITDRPIGAVLVAVVLFTFYDGIFRRRG